MPAWWNSPAPAPGEEIEEDSGSGDPPETDADLPDENDVDVPEANGDYFR